MKNQVLNITCLMATCIGSMGLPVFSQTTEYTIESFQSEYKELEKYESIYILTGGDILFDYEFELEFEFPFFDSSYTRVIYDQSAWGSFTDILDVALLLMDFSGGYTFTVVIDTSNLASDVRFSHVEQNGMKAFVIQFTNVFFLMDQFENEFGTSMNFQIWLWENGVLESHFGEIDMGDNPRYKPGIGFYCVSGDGGIDTTEICGPHMGISHPLNPDIAIGLQGAYDDYEVTGDVYSILTVLPPQGWVIRFKPMSVSTTDADINVSKILITPHPAMSYIQLSQTAGRVTMTDATGKIVWHGKINDDGTIDVTRLPPGIYFLQLISREGISSGKFVKQ